MSDRSLNTLATDPVVAAKYVVGEILASGGFGVVHAATQNSTRQKVVIKAQNLAGLERESKRVFESQLQREADVSAQLYHPNIVRLIDYGTTSYGALFVVFEYVPGTTLAKHLLSGPLSLGETRHLMTQVLGALACAHASNIAHRDLKPANIMVTETGGQTNAKVLDFGMATAAQEALRQSVDAEEDASVLVTPSYCAPEQLRGQGALHSDLFSWGLIFLECLSGQPVFAGRSLREVLAQQLNPGPIYVPTWLPLSERRLLLDVTEKNSERRNISAQEALSRLSASTTSLHGVGLRRHAWPTIFWRVPARNHSFTGRRSLLADLDTEIARENVLAVTALQGLGGIGKSQLALEYAYRRRETYHAIGWLRAEAQETLIADFADLATPLGLEERGEREQSVRVDAVRRWLESNDSWLLIFDNAPGVESIRELVPYNPKGRVLITSRSRRWRGLAQTLEVDPLHSNDAVEFLLKRTGDRNAVAARQLAEALGFLPLALEEAAAYVEETGRSIEAYIGLFRDHQKALLQRANPPSDHPMTVHATLTIGLEAAARESSIASDLINLLAFLAPENIPQFLLQKAINVARGANANEDRISEIDLDRGIAALLNYSLVTSGEDGLSVHRLVQLIIKSTMRADQHERWRRIVLRAIEASFPRSGAEGDARPENPTLVPHAMNALSDARVAQDRSAWFAGLLWHVGSYLGSTGKPEFACALLKEAVDVYASLDASFRSREARVSSNLALIEFAMGEMNDALEKCERALSLHEAVYGVGDFRIPQDLIYMATIQFRLGRLVEAGNSLDRATQVSNALGEANPFRPIILGYESRLYYQLGDARASLNSLEAAREYFDTIDVAHPFVTDTLSHIALMLIASGRFEEAIRYADRAINLGATSFGYAHPLVAEAVGIRGRARSRLGDHDGAIADFLAALEGGERYYARRQHEDVAIARAYLADALIAVGDLARARRELVRADELHRVDGDVRRLRVAIGLARMNLRRSEAPSREALPEAEATLRLAEDAFGVEHPAISEVLLAYADTLMAAHDAAGARAAYDRVLRLLSVYPNPHLDRGLAMAGLARVEQFEGGSRTNEYVWHAREILASVLPEQHAMLKGLADLSP